MNFSALTFFQKFWIIIASVILFYYAQAVVRVSLFPNSPLTVVGVGKLNVAPEKAAFIVSRVNESRDAVSAINEGEAGIKSLIDTTRSIAGDTVDIKTSFYQIAPTGTSYQVANAFSVTTSEVAKVSELVKSLYRGGATSLSAVSFTTADESKTEQQARELAIKDAKMQAERIAKASGKRLGKLLSVTDDNSGASSTIGTDKNSKSTQGMSDIEVTKRMQVVYELW